jgi:predicted TIM-barrel fold metal-dependent hydrolase
MQIFTIFTDMKRLTYLSATMFLFLQIILGGCTTEQKEFYTGADFNKVPKIDAHFHYNTPDARYLEYAKSLNFRFVTVNVDAGRSIDEQLEVAQKLKQQFPGEIAFFGTFSVDSFGTPGFSAQVIDRIDQCMKAGASGIKIWKNIGMELKDSSGNYVMADNPAFDPVFRYLEAHHIPLLAHLGEPRNCWLPLEKMTLGGDRSYFQEHPEYHMFLHPDAPSYEDQINARDSLLRRYPEIDFTGAHLGSLEWSVDEVAKRLDRYPNFQVEFSARIGHLQLQSMTEYEKVRQFMIKYQDRIMYGTDVGINPSDTNYVAETESLHRRWLDHWNFLVTDSRVIVNELGDVKVKGIKLPTAVIDKIYFKNASRFFKSGEN